MEESWEIAGKSVHLPAYKRSTVWVKPHTSDGVPIARSLRFLSSFEMTRVLAD